MIARLPYPNLQNKRLYTDKKASYSSRTVFVWRNNISERAIFRQPQSLTHLPELTDEQTGWTL